jgi:hypothetical protein
MAHHDLLELQRLARNAPRIFILDTNKSLRIVESYFGVTNGEARAIIMEIITLLDPSCFAHSLTNKVPPADVYGIYYRGSGWYVKVALDHGRPIVISCHPPEVPLTTSGGTVSATRR